MGNTISLILRTDADTAEFVAALKIVAAAATDMAAQIQAATKQAAAATKELDTEALTLKSSIANAGVQARIAHAETMSYAEATRRAAQAARKQARAALKQAQAVRISNQQLAVAADRARMASMEVRAYAEQTRRAAGGVSTSIRAIFPALSDLRQIVRLAFGVTALVYFAENLGKIYDGIVSASLALGGFSREAQKLYQEAETENQRLVEDSIPNLRFELAKVNKLYGEQSDAVAKLQTQYDQLLARGTAFPQVLRDAEIELTRAKAALMDTDDAALKLNEALGKLLQSNRAVAATEKPGVMTKRELAAAARELGREYPQLTRKELEQKAAVELLNPAYRAYIDNLIRATGRARELTEATRGLDDLLREHKDRALELTEVPARQRIELSIDAALRKGREAIERYRILRREGKITAKELEDAEKEYTELVTVLLEERADLLAAEDKKEAEQKEKRQEAAAVKFAALARRGIQMRLREQQWGDEQELKLWREREKAQERNLKAAEENVRRHLENVRQLLAALRAHGSFAGIDLDPLNRSLKEFNANLREAGRIAGTNVRPFTQMQFELAKLRESFGMVGISVDQFSKGMARATLEAVVYGDNVARAVERALKAELAAIATKAAIMAVQYTAIGFARLADFLPGSAAQAFEAAALFAAVAGVAGAAGAAVPGGGRAGGGAGAGGYRERGRGAIGEELGSPVGTFGGGGAVGRYSNTIVSIQGPIVGPQNFSTILGQLAVALNQGGQSGVVRIAASSSSSIPNPQA